MRNKLFVIILIIIIISSLGGINCLLSPFIPEKMAKDVLITTLREKSRLSAGLENLYIKPQFSLTAANILYASGSLSDNAITMPLILKKHDVRYRGHQFVSRDMAIYYLSANVRCENKVKIEARILLEKKSHKWMVKSVMIDSITPHTFKPSFLIY